MFEWLRFWRRTTRQPRGKSLPSSSAHSPPPGNAAAPPSDRRPVSPEPEPVLVRGDAWMNTAVDPHKRLPQPEVPASNGVPALVERLRHKEPTVRQAAAQELGQLGPVACEAIAALLAAAC